MSTGPYIEKDGVKSDRGIWEADMNPETEAKFDKYQQIKAVNKAAKEELAKRNVQAAFESLMEGFGEE